MYRGDLWQHWEEVGVRTLSALELMECSLSLLLVYLFFVLHSPAVSKQCTTGIVWFD
jgi:hypothetical protein